MRVRPLTACQACAASRRRNLAVGEHRLLESEVCGLFYALEFANRYDLEVDGCLTGIDTSYPQKFLAHVSARRLNLLGSPRAPGRLVDIGCGAGDSLAMARAGGWKVGAGVLRAVEQGYDRLGWHA